MAEDVAPALYEKIRTEIENALRTDRKAVSIQKKVDNGTATHVDTEEYALRVGKVSSNALLKNLDSEDLPDGKLYYNIADRVIGQTMRDNLDRVNNIGRPIQAALNANAKIGLSPMGGKMNWDRLDTLISDIANCEELDTARELLGEPIVNMTQGFADNLIKQNADTQYKVGLRPTITRTAEAGCCEWCANLAGRYSYPLSEEDEEVYHRHENCRCIVSYDPGKGDVHTGQLQDVWSKEWNSPEEVRKREERRTYGL